MFNFKKLVKFVVKRNIFSIVIWIVSILLATLILGGAFTNLFSSKEEILVMAETMKNPAMIAMVGPGYGFDNYTLGAMFSHEMILFTSIAIAIMSILIVNKNTRDDEEQGGTELIRSFPVGRITNLLSVNFVVIISFIVLIILTTFGLYFLKLDGVTFNGALLYACVLGVTGVFFASITSLFAQLSENSKTTLTYSFIVLGISYIVRAIGDVSNSILSLFSPLGIILKTEALVNNYWWPILIMLLVSIIIYIVSIYLNSIRDLQAGFISSKKSKKEAGKLLLSKIGLPLYLSKNLIIGWLIGLFILGLSYGSVFGDMETFIETNDMVRKMIQGNPNFSLSEQFIPMLMAVISMMSTVPVLLIVFKLKSEETKNRLDYIYSKKVSRSKIFFSLLFISFLSSILMLFIASIGLFLASNAVMDDPMSFKMLISACLVYLPALWIMISLTLLLIGYFPKKTNIMWIYLGFSFIVLYFGALLDFPKWLKFFTPYGYIAQLPIEKFNIFSSIILFVVFILLIFIGLNGYKKRDIE